MEIVPQMSDKRQNHNHWPTLAYWGSGFDWVEMVGGGLRWWGEKICRVEVEMRPNQASQFLLPMLLLLKYSDDNDGQRRAKLQQWC